MQININNNNINFQSRISNFSSKLDKVLTYKKESIPVDDLVDLTQTLISKRKEFTKKYRLLGEGYNSSVYKIDSKYALKVPTIFTHGIELPVFITGFSKKLKCYYGDAIATFGSYQILKNLDKHTPVGIPLSMSRDQTKLHLECEKYYEEKFLPMFAKIPQKSFNAIAKDCKILNEMKDKETGIGYIFDFANPNNFVIKKNQILITDGIICSETLNNTISDLFRAFLNYKELGIRNFSTKNNLPYFREIYKKIIIAGLKEGLPFGIRNLHSWKLSTNYLCNSKQDTEVVINTLSGLKWKYGNDNKGLEKELQQYFDLMFET